MINLDTMPSATSADIVLEKATYCGDLLVVGKLFLSLSSTIPGRILISLRVSRRRRCDLFALLTTTTSARLFSINVTQVHGEGDTFLFFPICVFSWLSTFVHRNSSLVFLTRTSDSILQNRTIAHWFIPSCPHTHIHVVPIQICGWRIFSSYYL